MRTLMKSFSLAALFTLSTACAVDPDSVETDEVLTIDYAETRSENLDEAVELPAADDTGRSTRDVSQRLVEKLEYCEHDYDCESKDCAQEIRRCRDKPF